MSEPIVWADDAYRSPAEPVARWNDRGLTQGLGLFETIEVRGRVPFALTRHLRRMADGAQRMRIGLPEPERLAEIAVDVAQQWGQHPGRLRITATAGAPGARSTLLVTVNDLTIQTAPTTVITEEVPRNERGALRGIKSTSFAENALATARASDAGAGEALFANTRDELCEGAMSNVFVEIDGQLITPPLSSGCLAGVTRALLIESLADAGIEVVERAVPMAALSRVGEMFLTSTGRHVQPVSQVDGVPLPSSPGALTEVAQRVWAESAGAATGPAIIDI